MIYKCIIKNIRFTTYALEKFPSFDIIVKNQFFILKVSVVVSEGWFLVRRYNVSSCYIRCIIIFLDIGATKGRHKKDCINHKKGDIRPNRLSVALRVLVKCFSILKMEFDSLTSFNQSYF